MLEQILFVFEGAKTEPDVFENLRSIFFPEEGKEFVTATYNTDVYALWREIKNTYGDDEIKLFQILKEKPWNEPALSGFEERDFSQIFLFFDCAYPRF